jgi:hypothetical protein
MMDEARIVKEFLAGATIDSLSKQLMCEERVKAATEHGRKRDRVSVTYKECRCKVEEVVLREVWNKRYLQVN